MVGTKQSRLKRNNMQFRFKSINGSKGFGFYFACWDKLYNRRKLIAIGINSIYSYYEGSLKSIIPIRARVYAIKRILWFSVMDICVIVL